ncbi:unnamed protein product [Heterobilharzia americana]|nr:unnamed protein product [Heterobilharzia americana]CAH8629859.1 unnamed protein product [Heterobilharzia americana]
MSCCRCFHRLRSKSRENNTTDEPVENHHLHDIIDCTPMDLSRLSIRIMVVLHDTWNVATVLYHQCYHHDPYTN